MKIYNVNKDLTSPSGMRLSISPSDEVFINFLENLRIEEFPIYIYRSCLKI